MGTTKTKTKTPLFSRKSPGGMFAIVNETLTTGNIYYVDSGQTTTGGTTAGYGTNPDQPFTTVASALAQCTASNGDMLFVMPGHAETLTTGVSVAKIGVSIVGLGNGDNRPTITVNGAIDGWNLSADDIRVKNIRFVNSTSSTPRTRLLRVAGSDITVEGCRFELVDQSSHMISIISGDNIQFLGGEYINANVTLASLHPQTAILNIGGTRVLVKGGRFNDCGAKKAERWRTVIEGGALASSTEVQDCTFICRGIATATRSAGASDGTGTQSPTMATIKCMAISPSANTSAGALYTYTYQYVIESYNVAAINKHALIGVSTSDKRAKTDIIYL
ncbi:hypothetical protein LCGC14_0993630 [marine sediment metagenome]|uniref:Right handed beta helix domain-containing protein n=1 Tax=marine sediment metagenome TaxID=412755 RepID=A0A0F9N515_9ZZZZ|nr:hypothetical protein [Pricia sp.]